MAEGTIRPVSGASGGRDALGVNPLQRGALEDNPFEAVFSKAVDALEGVSNIEFRANDLINQYVQGKANLEDVMIATSKMSIAVQLAVTTITTAVSTFKEITQMPM